MGKVMVPHPALGFPTSLSLTYKSYNGWLSRGLPLWSIYKVLVTDSYGQSYSLCKRYFALESGVPVRFDLLPGNCHMPEEVYELDEFPPPVTLDRLDEESSEFNKYESITTLNEHNLAEKKGNLNLHWQKLIDGNDLDRESTETSRGFDTTDTNLATEEVFEPVLRKDKVKLNRGRNLEGFAGEGAEILEPVLKATTQRITNEAKRTGSAQTDRKPREETGFHSVQLFPFRLGELLERAERYARQTLLPLISETAPKLFGFGAVVSDENNPLAEGERKGKEYRLAPDQAESESRPKNIYELLREGVNRTAQKIVQPRSVTNIKFYSNNNELSETSTGKEADIERSDAEFKGRAGHQISIEDIRIDLPTYRPPKQVKGFPYSFEGREEADFNNTTTTPSNQIVSTTPDRKRADDKVARSWLHFNIPDFQTMSRSFLDWTSLSASSGTTKTKRSLSQNYEDQKRTENFESPERRLIPLS